MSSEQNGQTYTCPFKINGRMLNDCRASFVVITDICLSLSRDAPNISVDIFEKMLNINILISVLMLTVRRIRRWTICETEGIKCETV